MTSANSEKIVTLIGGSGFVGRHIARSLAKRGYRIRVACRRPDLAGYVQPLGTPGQVMPIQANVRYPASLAAACDGAYAVVISLAFWPIVVRKLLKLCMCLAQKLPPKRRAPPRQTYSFKCRR